MPHEEKYSVEKRIELIGKMSLLAFAIVGLYFLLALVQGVPIDPFIFTLFSVASLGTYFINRIGKPALAKGFGLLTTNLMIFVVASSEPHETGIHFHFVSLSAIALILYGYEEWPKGIAFVLLSLSLYISSYLAPVSFLEVRPFTDFQANVFFVMNAFITASACTYIMLASARLSYESDAALRKRERLTKEQNELLLKTNQELDRFVYSVSHDLRAPLSSISGLIELADDSTEMNPTELKSYHALMKQSVKKLELFIRNIIDFSRNARMELQTQKVVPKMLVMEVFEALKFSHGASEVELISEIQSDASIGLDKSRFQVVLFNLISNAIQYRDKDKTHRFVKVRCAQVAGSFVLEVEDNGIGIAPDYQSKIFEMFFRASEISEGSGLGLYIVRETVLRMGGSVTLTSTPAGTHFVVTLPVKPVES